MSTLVAESYHLGHLSVLLLTVDSQVNTYLPYHSQQDLKIHINSNIIDQINIHKNSLIGQIFYIHLRNISTNHMQTYD